MKSCLYTLKLQRVKHKFSFRGAKIPPTIGLFVVLDGVVQASTSDFE
jgi:hypothetical protein